MTEAAVQAPPEIYRTRTFRNKQKDIERNFSEISFRYSDQFISDSRNVKDFSIRNPGFSEKVDFFFEKPEMRCYCNAVLLRLSNGAFRTERSYRTFDMLLP